MTEKEGNESIEEHLPPEMKNALDMVTAMLYRIKAFTKKDLGDYLERVAYLIAGLGMAQAIAFWVQYQILWQAIFGGG